MAKNEVKITITGDASKLQAAGNQSMGALDKLAAKAEKIGTKMQSVGQTLTKKLTLPIVGGGIAAFKFGADLEDAMGAADQVFKGSSDVVKKWADSLPDYYGIARSEALAHSNVMGTMLQNIGGMSEAEAGKMSGKLVELAGDMTAMFGGSTSDAIRALTGALKGNNGMLDNYGISALDAEIKAKALAMGIHDGTGALTAQQKQAATLAVIMEQTADVQGQAAREAEGGSGSMRSFTTSVKELAEDLGLKLLPAGTKILGWGRDMVGMFSNLSPKAQNIILVIAGIAAAIGPLLIVTGKLVTSIGAIAKALSFLAANPVSLVVIAVVALVAGLVIAYKKVEWFHDAVDRVAAFLKEKLTPIIRAVIGWLKDTWPKVVKTAGDIWTNTLQPALETVGKWITGTLWPILQKVGEFIVTHVVATVKTWAYVFTQVLWPALKAVGEWITGTLWPALQSFGAWIGDVAAPIVRELSRTWSEVLWPALKAVGRFLTGTLWPALKTGGNIISTVLTPVVKALGWTWSNVLWPALKIVASFITGTVWPVIKTIATVFINVGATVGRVVGEIVGFIIGIPRRIIGVVSTMWNGITSGIRTARDVVSNVVGGIVSVVTGIGRRIGSVASAITSPFRSAFDNIRSLWNRTVGGFGFDIPSWVPGVGGKGFKIPKMHTGGIVPGPRGAEVLTVLQAGELVIPADLTTGLSTTGPTSDSFTSRYTPSSTNSVIYRIEVDATGAIMTPDMPGKIVELLEKAIAGGHQTPRLARSLA